jgi:hypothetical protein
MSWRIHPVIALRNLISGTRIPIIRSIHCQNYRAISEHRHCYHIIERYFAPISEIYEGWRPFVTQSVR